MTATNEIIHFDAKSRFSAEHQSLASSLSYLDWMLQVQSITQSLGLPMEEVGKFDAVPPQGTLAHRLGHETIGSFITSSHDNYGLGIDWDKWAEKLSAFRNKNTYGIYADAPEEVNSELRDVIKILGHSPANSAEYHKAKDAVLLKKHKEARMHNEEVLREMQSRITTLIKSAETDRNFIVKEQERSAMLSNEIKEVMEESEKRISFIKKEFAQENEYALGQQRKELESQMHGQIELIKKESDSRIEELNAVMEGYKEKYSSENYVTRGEYQVLSAEIDKERASNRELQLKINDLNGQLSNLYNIISLKENEINDLRLSESDSRALISSLRSRVESLSSISGHVADEDTIAAISILNSKINTLESELDNQRVIYTRVKESNALLVTLIKKLKDSLKSSKKEIKEKNQVIKKAKVKLGKRRVTIHVMGAIISLLIGSALLMASVI